MPSSLNISDETKRLALEMAINNTSGEIYSLCLHVGLDPDLVDISDPQASFPDNALEPSNPLYHSYSRIASACAANLMATGKLAALNA